MNYLISNLLILCAIILLFTFMYIKQKKCKKVSDNLFYFLNKNLDFLTEMQHKNNEAEILKSIKVYSKFQIIQKISGCDYLSFFKYDHSKRHIELNYIFLMNNKGSIIPRSEYDKLIITNELIKLNLLKSDDNDLSYVEYEDIKEFDTVTNIIKNRELRGFYYKNIIYNDKPVGFITIGFKNRDYFIPEHDKIEILRILDKIKSII